MHLDHLHEGASPVRVSQPGLIRLSSPARAIALDVLRVNSLQTGAYVSRFRGRGMEFDESRPYQPGDDPRSIDWRVTARSTTAYTKLFREERERPVLVAVDLRSNMHFATRGCFKSVNASRAAALIAWAASWMRCHEPSVFLCALLNSQPMGFYSPATLIEDGRRRGVTVLPGNYRRS